MKTKGSNRYILAGTKGSWMQKRGVFVENITVVDDVLIGDEGPFKIRLKGGAIRKVEAEALFTKGWPGEVVRDPSTGELERQTELSSFDVHFVVQAVMRNLGVEPKNGDPKYHSSVQAGIDALLKLSKGGPPEE
jgi:hypothetical protein